MLNYIKFIKIMVKDKMFDLEKKVICNIGI